MVRTSTQVSPTTNQGIGGSDNTLGEHTAGPVLAHDKSSTSHTDAQSKNGESNGTVDKARAGRGDGGERQDDGTVECDC